MCDVHGFKEMQESIVPANGHINILAMVLDGLEAITHITTITMNLMDFIVQVKKISTRKIFLIECI